jgi:uncharacterized protein (DUF58 family)
MMKERALLADLFISPRLFIALGICIALYVTSFYISAVWQIANFALVLFSLLTLIDYALLFWRKHLLTAERRLGNYMSNGDDNVISIDFANLSNLYLHLQVIDELPLQFQRRDFDMRVALQPFAKLEDKYLLRPVERGDYAFGKLLVYASTLIGLIQRRVSNTAEQNVKVYPSYVRLTQGGLNSNAYLSEMGQHAIGRSANSLEFDHIKEYVRGDDIRHINWAASARRSQFMVNTYKDERSQQIFCIIDLGRLMKMPFGGMTLLEYAVNSTLMLSDAVLRKSDKIGVITFAKSVQLFLKPNRNRSQMPRILESLYHIETDFLESNYEALVKSIRHSAGQRSLLLLYTNFETYTSMQRQMPYLRMLGKKHLLCVVVFENTELARVHARYDDGIEGIYIKTIADKYAFEKKRIVKELGKEGILSIFTTPQHLTADVINKYLALKQNATL